MSQFLATTFIIVIVKIIMLLVNQNRATKLKNEDGKDIIKLPKGFFWFGIIMAILFCMSIIALLMTTRNFYEFNSLSFTISCLILAFLSILLAVAAINWEIIFDEEGFEYRTILGKTNRYKKSDIIDFNVGTVVGVIKTINNKKLFFDPNLPNVKKFLEILEKKDDRNNKVKEIEIKFTKGHFWIGMSCFLLSIFFSIMLIVPNESFERVTSWWGFLLLFIINYCLFIFTIGSLKWRMYLNDFTFIYITYFGRRYEFRYTDVNDIKLTSNFVIMKIKNKYFFIDANINGIEKFLKKVR